MSFADSEEKGVYVDDLVFEYIQHFAEIIKIVTGLAAGYHYILDVGIRYAAEHLESLIQ